MSINGYIETGPLYTKYIEFEQDEIKKILFLPNNKKIYLHDIVWGRITKAIGKTHAIVQIKQNQDALLKGSKNFQVGESKAFQVVRPETTEKQATLSDKIKLFGRYVILIPENEGIHFSKQFNDKTHKIVVKEQLKFLENQPYGVIIRGNSEKCSVDVICDEIKDLIQKWENILKNKKDLEQGEVENVLYQQISPSLHTLLYNMPSLPEKLKAIPQKTKFFNNPGLLSKTGKLDTLNECFKESVDLQEGIILHCFSNKAFFGIDVDSHKAFGKLSSYAVNKVAILNLKKIIDLRKISGLIIIDFITCSREQHAKLTDLLKTELKNIRCEIVGLSKLGVAQIALPNQEYNLNEIFTCDEFQLNEFYIRLQGALFAQPTTQFTIKCPEYFQQKLQDLITKDDLKHRIKAYKDSSVLSFFS